MSNASGSSHRSSSSSASQGGGGRRGGGSHSSHHAPKPRSAEGLPSPEVLEGYDYVVEGSAERILAMFEREQQHRHAWELRALKVHSASTILGQILGFAIAVAVFVAAIVIGMYGDTNTAAFIWVFGMAIIVMAGLVWTYAKSMGQRPLFARPAMRASFRPEKESGEA